MTLPSSITHCCLAEMGVGQAVSPPLRHLGPLALLTPASGVTLCSPHQPGPSEAGLGLRLLRPPRGVPGGQRAVLLRAWVLRA